MILTLIFHHAQPMGGNHKNNEDFKTKILWKNNEKDTCEYMYIYVMGLDFAQI